MCKNWLTTEQLIWMKANILEREVFCDYEPLEGPIGQVCLLQQHEKQRRWKQWLCEGGNMRCKIHWHLKRAGLMSLQMAII